MIKLIVDFMMVALLTLAMNHRITGDLVHGVFGIVLFVLFFLHILLNWGSLKKNFVRINLIKAIIIFLLGVTVLLIITSILLAQMIFNSFPLKTDHEYIRRIHVLLAYWLFVLSSLHLGLHLKFVIKTFERVLAKMTVLKIPFYILSFVFGVYSFVDRDFFYKLFGHYSYDNFNSRTSIFFVFLEFIAIFLGIMLWVYIVDRKGIKNEFF